jgi:hypothetical protein
VEFASYGKPGAVSCHSSTEGSQSSRRDRYGFAGAVTGAVGDVGVWIVPLFPLCLSARRKIPIPSRTATKKPTVSEMIGRRHKG